MNRASDVWQDLYEHQQTIADIHLQDLFKKNPNRFEELSLWAGDIFLDYSKQRVTKETIEKLCKFAEDRGLSAQIEALFSGEIVNVSEQRPALHTALRDPTSATLRIDGCDVKAEIQEVLRRLENFVESVRDGYRLGATGKRITSVLSLGIGGSDLGPSMICEALNAYKTTDISFHFISNVDGKTLATALSALEPASTLCIINSKTFTTPETLQNAKTVKAWFVNALGAKGAMQHLIGVTAYPERAEAFGILKDNLFKFWDFVGGRYSVWSAVGLPVALLLGMPQFKSFLAGAHEMDKHFYSAPFSENMPVLLGLLAIWNINFWGCATQAIIPYDDGLKQFPAYLQQLEMESNGKRAKSGSGFVSYDTAPVVWGGVGCNGQHAYMQLLHQGTQVIPVDFLLAANGYPGFEEHHRLLVASCLSQSKALMEGNEDELKAVKNDLDAMQETISLEEAKLCLGNRPSNMLIYSKLTPKVLGSLIALYEHKVFVQGILWGINSFDQWGVELGKKLVKQILSYLENPSQTSGLDSSTQGLINFCKKNSNES